MANIYSFSRRDNTYSQAKSVGSTSLDESDLSRVLPRQISTGTTRGTQTVGYGTAKIDGSNNRITIGSPDGSAVGIGSIPGSSDVNEYGFFSVDANGNLIMKIVNGNMYVYDPDNNVNVVQVGALTNGQYGAAIAKEGNDLVEALGAP